MSQAPSLLGFSWKCQGSRIGGCADSGRALLATCELQLPGDFNWGRETARGGWGHADIKRPCNLMSWHCIMHVFQSVRFTCVYVSPGTFPYSRFLWAFSQYLCIELRKQHLKCRDPFFFFAFPHTWSTWKNFVVSHQLPSHITTKHKWLSGGEEGHECCKCPIGNLLPHEIPYLDDMHSYFQPKVFND